MGTKDGIMCQNMDMVGSELGSHSEKSDYECE